MWFYNFLGVFLQQVAIMRFLDSLYNSMIYINIYYFNILWPQKLYRILNTWYHYLHDVEVPSINNLNNYTPIGVALLWGYFVPKIYVAEMKSKNGTLFWSIRADICTC